VTLSNTFSLRASVIVQVPAGSVPEVMVRVPAPGRLVKPAEMRLIDRFTADGEEVNATVPAASRPITVRTSKSQCIQVELAGYERCSGMRPALAAASSWKLLGSEV
jgi:hypothetical protein